MEILNTLTQHRGEGAPVTLKMTITFRRLSVWHSALAHYMRGMPNVDVALVDLKDEAGAAMAVACSDWSVMLVEDPATEQNQSDLTRLLSLAPGVMVVSHARPEIDVYWHQRLPVTSQDDLAQALSHPERLAAQRQ